MMRDLLQVIMSRITPMMKPINPSTSSNAIYLKENNRAFDVRKYAHSYPHCWRTDKPDNNILGFLVVRVSSLRDKLVETNSQIRGNLAIQGKGDLKMVGRSKVGISVAPIFEVFLCLFGQRPQSEEECVSVQVKSYISY